MKVRPCLFLPGKFGNIEAKCDSPEILEPFVSAARCALPRGLELRSNVAEYALAINVLRFFQRKGITQGSIYGDSREGRTSRNLGTMVAKSVIRRLFIDVV